MALDRKDAMVILEAIQYQSQFRDVPVYWAASRRGPRMQVTRNMGRGVVVRVNYSGLGFGELKDLVLAALKHANDMYREVTLASVVASEPSGEHRETEYVAGPGDLAHWKDQVLENWDEIFARSHS